MNREYLDRLLCCPVTGSNLERMQIGEDEAYLASEGGRLYPVIEGVIVTSPAAPQVRKLCQRFLERNEPTLRKLGPRYDAETTASDLCAKADGMPRWHEEEMSYWEAWFQKRLENPALGTPGWNRTLPRERLLEQIPRGIQGDTILEIGCGSAHTLFDMFGTDIPNYIGLDLSFHACLLTKHRHPTGQYVQASVERLPFRQESMDTIVSYGVFHHLPGHEENISLVLPMLKQGGYLIGSDPLRKPRIPRPWRQKRREGNGIELKTGMSPHNDSIDWGNLERLVQGHGRVCAVHREYSVLRHVMVKILYDKFGIQARWFSKSLMAVDAVWLATLGRLHPSIGPAGIHYAVEKI